ncbi:MAG: hypothetical protein JW751_01685 [Polyangiaceae bacterium]|nr:hypothetical protein [Polyangiaceae bacterium]
MSEPTRWRDDPERAPAGVLDLLHEARPVPAMPLAVRRRAARHLARAASASTALAWSWMAVKSAAAASAVGLVTVVATVTVIERVRSPSPAEPMVTAAPASVPASALPLPPAATPEEPTEPPAIDAHPAPPSPVSAFPDPSEPRDTLQAEARLVERARGALAQDPELSLTLARKHGLRYPRGKLGPERTLVEIEALRRLGRAAEARALAEGTLARHPNGLYAERVRRLLEEMTAGEGLERRIDRVLGMDGEARE